MNTRCMQFIVLFSSLFLLAEAFVPKEASGFFFRRACRGCGVVKRRVPVRRGPLHIVRHHHNRVRPFRRVFPIFGRCRFGSCQTVRRCQGPRCGQIQMRPSPCPGGNCRTQIGQQPIIQSQAPIQGGAGVPLQSHFNENEIDAPDPNVAAANSWRPIDEQARPMVVRGRPVGEQGSQPYDGLTQLVNLYETREKPVNEEDYKKLKYVEDLYEKDGELYWKAITKDGKTVFYALGIDDGSTNASLAGKPVTTSGQEVPSAVYLQLEHYYRELGHQPSNQKISGKKGLVNSFLKWVIQKDGAYPKAGRPIPMLSSSPIQGESNA